MSKRKSIPNGIIDTDIVWDAGADTYSHVNIKTWLDNIDVAIGALLADRQPLGAVQPWSFPDKIVPDGTTPVVPTGWAVCNGQTLTSSQHDFPDFAGVSIVVPDYRGVVLIGADPLKALRVAGNETTNPGIKGRQGANTGVVPPHHHRHSHTHLLNEGAASSDDTGQAMQDDGHDLYFINTDASGTGHNVALIAHTHHLLSQYISNAHKPSQINKRIKDLTGGQIADAALIQLQTSTQVLTAGGTDEVPLPTTGPGSDLTISAYQKSEGAYFIMKVKWGTDYNRPWKIRNSAGSVVNVGVA